MRLRANENPGHRPGNFKPLYVSACCWPRSRYKRKTNPTRKNIAYGGGSSAEQHRGDVKEVREFLRKNPEAELFDVELELHFGKKHAKRLMEEVRK